MKVITIVLFFAVAFVSALPTEDKSVLNTLSNIDVEQPEVDGELIREIRQYGGTDYCSSENKFCESLKRKTK